MDPALTPPGIVLAFDEEVFSSLRGNYAVVTCDGRTFLLHAREVAKIACAFAKRESGRPPFATTVSFSSFDGEEPIRPA